MMYRLREVWSGARMMEAEDAAFDVADPLSCVCVCVCARREAAWRSAVGHDLSRRPIYVYIHHQAPACGARQSTWRAARRQHT